MDAKNRKTLALIITFFTLIGVILVSCGRSETFDVAKDTFQETKISLPDEIGSVFDLCESENTLMITAFSKTGDVGSLWKSADSGETWSKLSTFTDLMGSNSAVNSVSDYDNAAYLSKTGEIFFILRNWLNDEKVTEEYFIIVEGKAHPISIVLPQKGEISNGIYHAVFADGGELIVEDLWGQLYRIDEKTGAILNSYLQDDTALLINDFTVAGDYLFVLTSDDLLTYSIQTGEQTKKTSVINKIIDETKSDKWSESNAARKIIATKTDTGAEFTYIDSNGIINFSQDKLPAKLIDGSNTCMYGGETTLYDFERTKDEKLFLIVQDRYGSALYRYEKSKSSTKENSRKTEITLYTLKANKDFETLIRLYRDSNPDIKITLTTGITENQDITVSDALKILNTDILSGHGPDIICFDNIDYSAFIENKMLLDLSPAIKDISQKENLFSNILNAYDVGNGLYVVPTKFSFPGIVGPVDLVDSSENLTSLNAKLVQIYTKNNNQPIFDGQFFDKTIRIFYQTYVAALTDDNSVPTRERLETFYGAAKTLYNICGGKDAREKDKRMEENGVIPYSYQEALNVIAGLNQISIQDIMGVRDMQALYTVQEKKGLFYRALEPDDINLFVGQNTMGINAKSERQDEAKAFLAFLLSKDAQNRVRPPAWENGFPVNKDVLSEQIEHAEIAGPTIMNKQEEDIQIKYKELTTKDIEKIFDLINQLNTPANSDLILYEIITEPLEKYLDNKMSLSDIVNVTGNKLDIYTKE